MSLSAPEEGHATQRTDESDVTLVTGRWDAAGRYRCAHAVEQLRTCGVGAEAVSVLDPDVEAQVGGRRVVIFHRVGLDRFAERLYRRVQDEGGITVFDTDDLVFDAAARLAVPHRLYGMDLIRAAWVREDAEAHRRAMQQADAVLVATDYLADETREVGTPTWVHRNGFSLEMLRLSEDARTEEARAQKAQGGADAGRRGRIVVGYASGTPTHDADFGVAEPALVRLLQAHADVELWLVGPVDPGGGWGRARDRIRRIPLVPWRDLPRVLARFDINIAPLDSTRRACRGKSEVKYIEGGLVEVPTVASAGAGFDQAICSGENGLLASSTEDWVEHLRMLIDDPERRRRMGERAYADVLARYHPAVRGRELLSTLNAVSRAVRGRALWSEVAGERLADRGSARPAWSSLPTPSRREPAAEPAGALLLRRGLYSLRYRGLRMFLMELWISVHAWWRGLRQSSPHA